MFGDVCNGIVLSGVWFVIPPGDVNEGGFVGVAYPCISWEGPGNDPWRLLCGVPKEGGRVGGWNDGIGELDIPDVLGEADPLKEKYNNNLKMIAILSTQKYCNTVSNLNTFFGCTR